MSDAGQLTEAPPAARSERSWGKFLLALLALLLVPALPQFSAILPVEQTTLLLVPAIAACALVGWWAGGKLLLAVFWIGIAVLVAGLPAAGAAYRDLVRGWSLLVAGAFGLVCLFGNDRRFFVRALTALIIAFVLAGMMGMLGAGGPALRDTLAAELERRNANWTGMLETFIARYPREWAEVTSRMPDADGFSAQLAEQLRVLSRAGVTLFPSLLALQSLAALGVAWSAYHRVSRARLGPPLAPLREFRFNDQLVWGLIVGLTLLVLPTLSAFRGLGQNLLLFFGTLYAVRGLGVLSWFLPPNGLGIGVAVGVAMLFIPVIQVLAVLGFFVLVVASFGLGLGDTWADWRSRARSTT